MFVSIIVAASDPERVIGKDGKMPWHLPSDLERFRKLTGSGTVIMGYPTLQSIGHPLKNRQNIVLTRSNTVVAKEMGCVVAATVQHALALANHTNNIFVIGGEKVYELFLPVTKRIYLTWVDAKKIEGDRYFLPGIDLHRNWGTNDEERRLFQVPADPADTHQTAFKVYDRLYDVGVTHP
jgi:dihydrofolate reductase